MQEIQVTQQVVQVTAEEGDIVELGIIQDVVHTIEVGIPGPQGTPGVGAGIGEEVPDANPYRVLTTDSLGQLSDEAFLSIPIEMFGGLLSGNLIKPANFDPVNGLGIGGFDASAVGGAEVFGIMQSINSAGSFGYVLHDPENPNTYAPAPILFLQYDPDDQSAGMIFSTVGQGNPDGRFLSMDSSGFRIGDSVSGGVRIHRFVDTLEDDSPNEVPTVRAINEALGSGTVVVEARDKLNILLNIEDREKYAVLGGGTIYDSKGFTMPNQGAFGGDGVVIYEERVPIWGAESSSPSQWQFQETFTIEDDAAWGGDMVETAICWQGRIPTPFLEVTTQDSAAGDWSGNGYGEYPTTIWSANEYNGERFMLQRVLTEYDPTTGALRMYRPAYEGFQFGGPETPVRTDYGVNWVLASEIPHAEPGAHPMVAPAVGKPLQIGKGSGRYLVSRIAVKGFDGTPYCDFNPSENAVDANTVYDPVADDNWTNEDAQGGAAVKIIESKLFAERWLNDSAEAATAVGVTHLLGTWSAGTNNVNYFDGSPSALLTAHPEELGDLLRVRSAGTIDIGNGAETFAVNDLIYWDGTNWRHIHNTSPTQIADAVAALVDSSPATLDTLNELAAALGDDPNFATTMANALANKANTSHTHSISDTTSLQAALDAKAASSHTHDDRYYTETETDNLLDDKSDVGHNHNSEYYTKAEIDAMISQGIDFTLVAIMGGL